MSENRVYLVHNVTKQSTEVPDLPDVLAGYADRGWLPAERPAPVPFVPSPDGIGPGKYLDPANYTVPVSAPDDSPPTVKKVK